MSVFDGRIDESDSKFVCSDFVRRGVCYLSSAIRFIDILASDNGETETGGGNSGRDPSGYDERLILERRCPMSCGFCLLL